MEIYRLLTGLLEIELVGKRLEAWQGSGEEEFDSERDSHIIAGCEVHGTAKATVGVLFDVLLLQMKSSWIGTV
ncbi:hypothetical protein GW17_00014822 [Ensete ventricosum]|nr:hypothetical protein GW17_00014822 [Ensete ventricosum]RZS05562.1 hypothetical protein BHM03_00036096 [Ensete ventricosum]